MRLLFLSAEVLSRPGLSRPARPYSASRTASRRDAPGVRLWGAALLAVLLLPAALLLNGCGGNAPSNSGGSQVHGNVVLTSPASGATLKSLPTVLSFTFSGDATPSNSSVLVNGTDISKLLVAGSGGTYTASLGSSYVYIGNNRVTTAVGASTSSASFTYDPTTADFRSPAIQDTNTAGKPISDVLAIQTRVQVTTDSNGNPIWGVQIGSYNYTQPIVSVHNGMQVIILRRLDLSPVSNSVYDFDNASEVKQFGLDIAAQPKKTSDCGSYGCVEIIQSLSTAIPQCNGDPDCLSGLDTLASIGGTNIYFFAAHTPSTLANVAYSFVGNVNGSALAAGVNFERITCSAASGCPADFAASKADLQQGLAPNGTDGILPTLNSTGAPGTTNLQATTSLPALTISNNGALGGELVLDNNNAYTFTYNEPPLHYAMGRDPDNPQLNDIELRVPAKSNLRFPDGSTRIFLQSDPLPANPDGSTPGGFFLAAFDATTLQTAFTATYVINPAACPEDPVSHHCGNSNLFPLHILNTHLTSNNSRHFLFFLQSMGNLAHDCPAGQQCEADNTHQGGLPIQDVWDNVAQGIQDVGGTFSTFVSLDNPAFAQDPFDQYTPSKRPDDDYQMVGQWWFPHSGVANPNATEESSQINRQTIAEGGGARMSGLLEKERDGYFRATLESNYGDFFPPSSTTFLAAPLLPPVAWPFTSSTDSAGVKAAYAWTSQQLLQCITNCSDIRAAYPNLNQDPAVWLALLVGLRAPADCTTSCSLGFSSSDFQTVQTQLETEIQYVAGVRQYQGNLIQLLQAEQSNRGLILQQEVDALQANTTIDLSTTSYPGQNWRSYVTEGIKIFGPVSKVGFPAAIGAATIILGTDVAVPGLGPAVAIASALGIAALDISAKKTNQVNGAPIIQQEHELYAASQLAGQLADQYSEILISVGHDFNRIYADWGRLSAIGSTITQNNLPWSDDATGKLLKTFDLETRRQFVRTLLASGYVVSHFTYASPGLNPGFGQVFLPDGPRKYEGHDQNGVAFWDHCEYYAFMQNQMAGNRSDPTTQQTPESYLFIPASPISGPGLGNGLTNHYPFDLWWDVWTLQQSQFGQGDPCADTNNMPQNGLFLNTGMFQPLDPDNPNALGLYKTWLFQRDLANVVFEPKNPSAGFRDTESSSFWTSQIQGDLSIQVPTYNVSYPLPVDPPNY